MHKFLPLILTPALAVLFLPSGCEIKPAKNSGDLNATKKISIVTTTSAGPHAAAASKRLKANGRVLLIERAPSVSDIGRRNARR